MLNFILKPLLSRFVKNLPAILSFLITKGLVWVIKNHPEKVEKIKEVSREIGEAVSATIFVNTSVIEASADGIMTEDEIRAINVKILDAKTKWKAVFE